MTLRPTHLSVVDGDDGSDELGGDDQVAEVGLDDGGLVQGAGLCIARRGSGSIHRGTSTGVQSIELQHW